MLSSKLSIAESYNDGVEEDNDVSSDRDPFSHLLRCLVREIQQHHATCCPPTVADCADAMNRFPEEYAPVLHELEGVQDARRRLDQDRIDKNIVYLDRLNQDLSVNIKERIESDMLIDKLLSTRLDIVQRQLVSQVEAGFKSLQDELDEAKERLRIASEKLFQAEVDAEIQLKELQNQINHECDRCQEGLLIVSQDRFKEDINFRETIPDQLLSTWRILNDEKDVMQGIQEESRYRLLPLEHSDLNDVESTVAQQKIREEMADLIRQLEEETNERIKEEKAQAAKARALTDALMQGLEIVNRNMYASPVSSPRAEEPPAGTE
ncbi:hypothetical protein GUITHDRAFT_152502 [Guillardia theta CCMP2712]|uniref:Uncharacterized protein n=4 Tax=Guillardia theta TaxID=55529 RepID=L1JBV4_GUITC|nr:hypothetical protein GUITHDRAFT_152502 [Guillardia theta CCMP2712]EKX46001.1 hypothetical protein GUITHDRAFT_152502 [Guillardia theta CCMP2712]|eukprot:XP_005832981.1 hypothetical protein GUITHDRAFT_152502 [Guillardia theta CCMP2712]